MSDNKPGIQKIAAGWDKASNELLQLLNNTSETDLNKTTESGAWSMAQVANHLLKSYNILHILEGNTEKPSRKFYEKVAHFTEVFKNDEIKMKSPEPILPENGKINKDSLLIDLQKKIKELKDVIQTKDLAALCLEFPFPQDGFFTRWEWISFAIVHTERHVRQLKRIKKALANTYAN